MRPVMVVVADVLGQEPFQMPLIQNDHMIQQVSTATSHPALRNTILPRATESGAHGPASHLCRGRHHVIAKLRVTVEQQKSMGRSIGPSFPHLLHDPECVRILCDVEAKYLAPIMPDDEEAVKNTKGKRWHGEEVHGCDRVAVIPQERQPALAWICSSPNSSKPSRDGRFRDAKP